MKIKSDFVTNSSTTSYIIICDGNFSQQELFDLMGIQKGSVFTVLAKELYQLLQRNLDPARSAWQIDKQYAGDYHAYLHGHFSEKVLKKVQEAERIGRSVFIGSFSSDQDITEALFCCDSFEWENDKLYINGLHCAW